jgi:formylglycine-generating enzyme required for sulfatase activity
VHPYRVPDDPGDPLPRLPLRTVLRPIAVILPSCLVADSSIGISLRGSGPLASARVAFVHLAILVALAGCGGRASSEEQEAGSAQDGSSMDQSASGGGSGGGPPSCAPGGAGMTNCGTGGTESCCTSLDAIGGSFDRTYPAPGPSGGADPATVSGFRLDKYLVTVGRFRQFVGAVVAGWTPSAGAGKHTQLNGGNGLAAVPVDAGLAYESGWDVAWTSSLPMTLSTWDATLATFANYPTWTPSPGIQENLPIIQTSWLEAYAFCIWDGGFLPSDAELEYAAAGGAEQLPYPWGQDGPQGGPTTYSVAIYCCYYPTGGPTCEPGITNIAPVGTAKGAGRWGQLDLVGEVPAWTMDWYASFVSPCTDCCYLAPTSARSVRGGGYEADCEFAEAGEEPLELHPTYRSQGVPSGPDLVGVRCARTP